jgi:hypothetical protein
MVVDHQWVVLCSVEHEDERRRDDDSFDGDDACSPILHECPHGFGGLGRRDRNGASETKRSKEEGRQ